MVNLANVSHPKKDVYFLVVSLRIQWIGKINDLHKYLKIKCLGGRLIDKPIILSMYWFSLLTFHSVSVQWMHMWAVVNQHQSGSSLGAEQQR